MTPEHIDDLDDLEQEAFPVCEWCERRFDPDDEQFCCIARAWAYRA